MRTHVKVTYYNSIQWNELNITLQTHLNALILNM